MTRSLFLVLALTLGACSRRPVAPGHVRLKLDRPQQVSLGLFAPDGHLVAQPLVGATLVAGTHEIDCEVRDVPAGSWTWKAVAFDPPTITPIVRVGGGVVDASPGRNIAGGDAGPPAIVATDDTAVYLGWSSARHGHEVVACDLDGRVLWGHHHLPGQTSGVRGLSADGGSVFVLADGPESELYRLDAKTGAPLPWDSKPNRDLSIKALWGSDAKSSPARADYLTAKNGRIYLTFAEDQFIAVLDATTGAYVTTMTGPNPGPMAFSTTPMRDPQTGETKVIDFGVAAIAGNGLAYFLMEHEPPWVMMSTTRWLQQDEKIATLTLHGDTMKSGDVIIYTALSQPNPQVQLRPAEAAEGFAVAVGLPQGRPEFGPWNAEALRDIRSIAVDAKGQLWIAENNGKTGRFSVWSTTGKQGELLRDIFGPLDSATLHVDEADPSKVSLGGWKWSIDPAGKSVACTEQLERQPAPSPRNPDLRHASGLVLWSPPMEDREKWSLHRAPDGSILGMKRGAGVETFTVSGTTTAYEIGSGSVSTRRPGGPPQ